MSGSSLRSGLRAARKHANEMVAKRAVAGAGAGARAKPTSRYGGGGGFRTGTGGPEVAAAGGGLARSKSLPTSGSVRAAAASQQQHQQHQQHAIGGRRPPAGGSTRLTNTTAAGGAGARLQNVYASSGDPAFHGAAEPANQDDYVKIYSRTSLERVLKEVAAMGGLDKFVDSENEDEDGDVNVTAEDMEQIINLVKMKRKERQDAIEKNKKKTGGGLIGKMAENMIGSGANSDADSVVTSDPEEEERVSSALKEKREKFAEEVVKNIERQLTGGSEDEESPSKPTAVGDARSPPAPPPPPPGGKIPGAPPPPPPPPPPPEAGSRARRRRRRRPLPAGDFPAHRHPHHHLLPGGETTWRTPPRRLRRRVGGLPGAPPPPPRPRPVASFRGRRRRRLPLRAGASQVHLPPPPPLRAGVFPGHLPLHPGRPTATSSASKVRSECTPSWLRKRWPRRFASSSMLHWDKLQPHSVRGTVWEDAGTVDGLDLGELDSLFALEDPNAAKKKKKPEGDGKPKAVSLIDSKRSLNISIQLAGIRMPFKDIKKALLSMDDTVLGLDQLNILTLCVPTMDEVKLLKNYPGDKAELATVEQYFLQVMAIPRLSQRISSLVFRTPRTPTWRRSTPTTSS